VNSLDWRKTRTGRSPKENRLKAKKLVSPEPENKTFRPRLKRENPSHRPNAVKTDLAGEGMIDLNWGLRT
jgi:hypothetical protein